jgi:hypothetical protein
MLAGTGGLSKQILKSMPGRAVGLPGGAGRIPPVEPLAKRWQNWGLTYRKLKSIYPHPLMERNS